MLVRTAFMIFAVGMYSPQSDATKPCDICLGDECSQQSAWIAVGRIREVEEDKQPYPLNKNFASFTFVPEKIEKGDLKPFKPLFFKVGWCENPKELPENTRGFFRFYGKSDTEYLGFDKLAD